MYLPSAFRPEMAYINAKGWGQNIVLSQFIRKFAYGKQAIEVMTMSILPLQCFPMKSYCVDLYAILCTMFHRYGLYRVEFLFQFIRQIIVHADLLIRAMPFLKIILHHNLTVKLKFFIYQALSFFPLP